MCLINLSDKNGLDMTQNKKRSETVDGLAGLLILGVKAKERHEQQAHEVHDQGVREAAVFEGVVPPVLQPFAPQNSHKKIHGRRTGQTRVNHAQASSTNGVRVGFAKGRRKVS